MEIKVRMDPVDRVKNMVRHSLVASPSVSNRELFDRAQEIAPAVVEGMSLRQFHAKFRLPITRHEMGSRPRAERKPRSTEPRSNGTATTTSAGNRSRSTRGGARKRAGRAAAGLAVDRSHVRALIVDFAVALETAEGRGDLVRVVAAIDDVVDQILSLTGGREAAAKTRPQPPADDAAPVPEGATANGNGSDGVSPA